MRKGVIFLLGIFFISLVGASLPENALHVNIQTQDSDGSPVTGTFEFNLSIYTSSDCSSGIVYSQEITKTTDSNGIVSIYLNSTENIDFSEMLYLGYYRNDVLKSCNRIVRIPYAETSGKLLNESNQDIGIMNFTTTGTGFFDYIGIGVTNPLHNLDIIGDFLLTHIATTSDEHGLELKIDASGFGDVKGIDLLYTTGAIATGDDEGVILIGIDEFLATGGDVFGVEVLSTEGSANIYGLKVGALVGPIHQDSGTFSDMDSATVNGVDKLAEFISTASDVEFFTNDNDYITIGDANKFEEIEFILDTPASINVKPTFEYSTGIGTWGTFSPTDGTNGMENNGIVAWEDEDIPTWTIGTGSEYIIKITRTKNNIQTAPIEDKVQISSVTEYIWDKSGNLFVRNVNASANLNASQFCFSDICLGGWAPLNQTDLVLSINTTANIQNLVNDSINSSNYWDNLDSYNTTQMENSDNLLNILESWLTTFADNWLGTKTTDDLTEGSTNKYFLGWDSNLAWQNQSNQFTGSINITGKTNMSATENYMSGLNISKIGTKIIISRLS